MLHPLMKLYGMNRKRGTFRADASPSGDSATVYLYDMIVDTDQEAEWFGGVSPGAFAEKLNAITAPTIHLRVKSPGGSVFAGRAMEQALREHPSNIIAHIDGLAASAASFLILGADERVAAPGSFVMIHKAWSIAAGNDTDMHAAGDLLAQVDQSLIKSYAAHTGQSEEDIAAWMAAETWMEADRAAELGFIDRVATAEKKQSAMAWDLSAYRNAPAAEQPEQTQQPDRDALARQALARIASLPPA